MPGLGFFDTNIMLYADDTAAPKKQTRATLAVSLQVLQEYYAAATRKLRVDPALAQRKIEILARARIVRLDENDIVAAIELHRLSQISFWDALIVQAARLANATVLYSEDLSHCTVPGGVRVENPFLPANAPR